MVCASKTNSGKKNYNPAGTAAGEAHARAMAALYGMSANTCHLAPSVLGGTGQRSNVAYCWRLTNVGANSMREVETEAQNQVKAGLVIEYEAIPIYHDAKSTVPTGFWLGYVADTASGQYVTSNMVKVENDANNTRPNLGN